MGRGDVDDSMLDFKKAHKYVDIVKNLEKWSMDGPNVNWAFLDSLEEYRKSQNPSAPDLFNIGSYGLHVLHGHIKQVIRGPTGRLHGAFSNNHLQDDQITCLTTGLKKDTMTNPQVPISLKVLWP